MAEITLIRGPVVLSSGRVGSVTASPPLGIAYVASYLLKHGKSADIIDAYGEDPLKKKPGENYYIYGLMNEEIAEKISADMKIAGFSCMFSNEWFYLKQLIAIIKKRFPYVTTVLGGEHATALAEYCLSSCSELDYVIMGEGERTFLSLAEFLLRRTERKEDIGGLAYRHPGGGIMINPRGGRIRDLNEVPWPAWHLVPVENYLKNGIAVISAAGSRIMPVLASRGCPYSCKFCSSNKMWGRSFIMRDYKDVVREIKYYKEIYGINGFELHDLTFIMNREWVINFAKELIDQEISLTWNVQATRSEAISEEVVNYLFESGCRNLTLTPDSGSERQLNDMNKKVDLKKITEKVRLLLRKNIILKVNLVIGFPDERHRDIWKTILYGIKLSLLGTNNVLFYRFVPYPGSPYFELLQERKMFPDFRDDFDRFLITNIYNELSDIKSYSRYVSSFALRLYLFFGYIITQLSFLVFHPFHIFKMFRRIIKKQPQSQIEILMLNVIRKIGFLH